MDKTTKWREVVTNLNPSYYKSHPPLNCQKDQFQKLTEQLRSELDELHQFIDNHRMDYVNPLRHFSKPNEFNCEDQLFHSSDMSEKQRDLIESYVQHSFKQFMEKIEVLKEMIVHGNESADSVLARKGILLILSQRIDKISTVFQSQRALRLEQELNNTVESLYMDENEFVQIFEDSDDMQSEQNVAALFGNDGEQRAKVKQQAAEFFGLDLPEEKTGKQIYKYESEDFITQLYQENRELQEALESKVDQVREVEKQVVEISSLQETFSTKVEEQAEEIESIHQITVSSTSNVEKARDALQKTKEDANDFRLFIMVVISTLAGGLLFVHYYN